MRSVHLSLIVIAILYNVAHAEERHERWVTDRGVIHVWTPDGYDPDTAGIVVYLHGYYTTVDRAWTQHRLPAQFAASKMNALFIACATPDGPRRSVAWVSLSRLLAAVDARLGGLPPGRRIAVAHSGGHRTLTNWLRDRALDTAVLVDALYAEEPEYRAWIEASRDHRLIDVAVDTRPWADALHAALRTTRWLDSLDDPAARDERIVYARPDLDHMELVTGGHVLPQVLRLLRIPEITVNTAEGAPSSLL